MKYFIIQIGFDNFALPEDTGICVQDLLLQAVPIRPSSNRNFNFQAAPDRDTRTVSLEELEPAAESKDEEEKAVEETAEEPPPSQPSSSFDDDIPF